MAHPNVVRLVADPTRADTFIPEHAEFARRERARRAAQAAKRAATATGRTTAHAAVVSAKATAKGTVKASRVTGRTAVRFRAELVPYTVAAALLVLTTLHHRAAGPDAGSQATWAYGAPAMGAFGISYLAAKRGNATAGPVCAASAVVGVLLAWAAWTVSAGPTLDGLLVLGFLATAAGIPYWMWLSNKRNPRHVEVTLPGNLVANPVDLVDPFKPLGLEGAHWVGAREPTPSGYRTVLAIPPGTNGRTVANRKGPDLAHLLDVGVDDVELIEADKAARVNVLVHTLDLLAHSRSWPNLDHERVDLYSPVPIGQNRTGELVNLHLVAKHLLIAGETGSGKSNVMTMIVAAAALDPAVAVFGIDGKVTELPLWRDRMTAYVDDNPVAALAMLNDLRRTMGNRQRLLREANRRNVTRADGLGLIVLVIDELARFTLDATGDLGRQFLTALLDLLQVGRSVGLIVVAATQRPSGDLITGDVRAGFTYRMVLRMSDGQGSRMALGEGFHVSAATLDPGRPGLAYLSTGELRPRMMRAFCVGDDDLATLAARAGDVPPPALPGVVVSPTVADYDPDGDRDTSPLEHHDPPSVARPMVRHFPNGAPIPSHEVGLWDALAGFPDGASVEDIQLTPGSGLSSRSPITDRMRKWTLAGHLEHRPGRTNRWRRLDITHDAQVA